MFKKIYLYILIWTLIIIAIVSSTIAAHSCSTSFERFGCGIGESYLILSWLYIYCFGLFILKTIFRKPAKDKAESIRLQIARTLILSFFIVFLILPVFYLYFFYNLH